MADQSTYRSAHTGQQIDTAVDRVSDSSLNPSKEGHIITIDSSGNLKASSNTLAEIETLKSDVSRLDSVQTNLESAVDSLEDDYENLSGRITTLGSKVESLEDFKADQLIENQDIANSFNNVNDEIRGIYNDLNDLRDSDAAISGRVNILGNQVNSLEDRVLNQEENLRLFGIGLANVSRKVTNLEERVAHLEGQTLPSDVRVIYENDESTGE